MFFIGEAEKGWSELPFWEDEMPPDGTSLLRCRKTLMVEIQLSALGGELAAFE